jgi:hypothetical protein
MDLFCDSKMCNHCIIGELTDFKIKSKRQFCPKPDWFKILILKKYRKWLKLPIRCEKETLKSTGISFAKDFYKELNSD